MNLEKIARAVFRSTFAADEDEALVAKKWKEWPSDRRKAERAAQAALTAMLEGFAGDGVTEGDRQARSQLIIDLTGTMCWDSPLIENAFARHRQLAAAAERARIVADIRSIAEGEYKGSEYSEWARHFADAIERGEG